MKRKTKRKIEDVIWILGERSVPLNLSDSLKIRDGLNNASTSGSLSAPQSHFFSKYHPTRLKTFSLN